MDHTGLENQDILAIKSIFSKFPEIEKVILYGSRAMGNYKPASDIDLSLVGDNIDLTVQQKIEFELDDLMLPYKFDLSIYHKSNNPEFIAHIQRLGKEFYIRKKADV